MPNGSTPLQLLKGNFEKVVTAVAKKNVNTVTAWDNVKNYTVFFGLLTKGTKLTTNKKVTLTKRLSAKNGKMLVANQDNKFAKNFFEEVYKILGSSLKGSNDDPMKTTKPIGKIISRSDKFLERNKNKVIEIIKLINNTSTNNTAHIHHKLAKQTLSEKREATQYQKDAHEMLKKILTMLTIPSLEPKHPQNTTELQKILDYGKKYTSDGLELICQYLETAIDLLKEKSNELNHYHNECNKLIHIQEKIAKRETNSESTLNFPIGKLTPSLILANFTKSLTKTFAGHVIDLIIKDIGTKAFDDFVEKVKDKTNSTDQQQKENETLTALKECLQPLNKLKQQTETNYAIALPPDAVTTIQKKIPQSIELISSIVHLQPIPLLTTLATLTQITSDDYDLWQSSTNLKNFITSLNTFCRTLDKNKYDSDTIELANKSLDFQSTVSLLDKHNVSQFKHVEKATVESISTFINNVLTDIETNKLDGKYSSGLKAFLKYIQKTYVKKIKKYLKTQDIKDLKIDELSKTPIGTYYYKNFPGCDHEDFKKCLPPFIDCINRLLSSAGAANDIELNKKLINILKRCDDLKEYYCSPITTKKLKSIVKFLIRKLDCKDTGPYTNLKNTLTNFDSRFYNEYQPRQQHLLFVE